MKILYVYAHPSAASFNSVLKQKGLNILEEEKHSVVVSDLYAQKFNASADWNDFNFSEIEVHPQYSALQKIAYDKKELSEDISKELEKVSWADHIIFQFPLWWFSVPAILKGWFDRVLVKGFAYDAGKVFSTGLLKGKTASLVLTTQSLEADYQLNGIHGCTIDTFLHPIHHTLKFVGIENFKPFVVYGAFDINEKKERIIFSLYHSYLKHI